MKEKNDSIARTCGSCKNLTDQARHYSNTFICSKKDINCTKWSRIAETCEYYEVSEDEKTFKKEIKTIFEILKLGKDLEIDYYIINGYNKKGECVYGGTVFR